MTGNHASTRPLVARKPHRYQVYEGLDVRFLRHANSAHGLQTLWRGLEGGIQPGVDGKKGGPGECIREWSTGSQP